MITASTRGCGRSLIKARFWLRVVNLAYSGGRFWWSAFFGPFGNPKSELRFAQMVWATRCIQTMVRALPSRQPSAGPNGNLIF